MILGRIIMMGIVRSSQYFFTVFLLVLLFSFNGVGQSQTVDWPSEDPPPPLITPEIEFPDYELRRLSNGLQVFFVGAHEQPVVNVRLLVRAGASRDPEQKPGVASMAAKMLNQGTTSLTAQQIAETIDNVGGGLSVGAGSDHSFVNILVMKDSFNLAIELLADMIRQPAYSAAELSRLRQQLISGMRVSYDDPAYVASIVFERLVYGEYPYGFPLNGTPASLQNITREDLIRFHESHYMPNNAILAIVGDVTADEAFDGVSRMLSDWQRGPLPIPRPLELPQPTSRLIVIDKPGAVQTVVRVGHLALPRAHPDYLAFDVAVKILGGEGGNRLGGVLRTERSLTYSASADLAGHQYGGDFMAETETRSSATVEALGLMVDQIARLQRERVRRRELTGAQNYLAGNFPLTLETPNAIASQVLEAIFFGLNLDDLEAYPELINKVTPDDIQRVTRDHLRPEDLSIVLAGDASTFVDDLASVGFSEYEIFPITEINLSELTPR